MRLVAHLQKLPMPYVDQTALGDLISRCTADVDTLDALFSSSVASLLADVLRLASVSVALVVLSPRLALISALVIPPLVWVMRLFQAVRGLHIHLREPLGSVEVVHAFGREAAFVQGFRLALRVALAASNRSTGDVSLYTPFMAMISALVLALLLWIGALNAGSAWAVSLGRLTAFVLLFRRFFAPIVNLGDEWQTVQSALSGAERIFQVLSLPAEDEAVPAEAAPSPAAPAFSCTAGLALCDVTFGYLPGRPVLRGVSLHVNRGEQVALVGRTGAGKTTALHLLAGLYAPWQGTARVAGRDPRSLRPAERSRWVGVVPQLTQLFSGTLFDNLTLGGDRVTRTRVERAAAITGAARLIEALPLGYATVLGGGPGRAQFSAGQQQLLALTRALVDDPPVLLLDEATALVDSATEAGFRAALRADGARAVQIIAHRLATARAADRVIVLAAGRIVEVGPPEHLIEQGGRFAAMLELEAAGWDWRGAPRGRQA